ncbi:MAG: phasin family protein [Kiloniellales bacterium]|nr:phasin family protein [Kiloniellales bacterium]
MAVRKSTAAKKPRAAARSTQKKTETVVAAGTEVAQSVVDAGVETVEAAVKTGTEAAAQNVERAVTTTNAQVKKASKAMFAGYGDFSAMSQENIDAVVKAGQIMAVGMESVSRELMSFAKAHAEANAAAATKMFSAKTMQEAIDLQNAYARESFDKAVAETGKLTEMSVKFATDAFAPIQSRVNVTVEKLLKPTAV